MRPADLSEKTPTTAKEEAALYAEQVRQLASNAIPGLVATAINALLLVFIQREVTSRFSLVAWLAVLAGIGLFGYRDIRKFWRTSPEASEAGYWAKKFTVNLALLGLAWGSSAILLFPANSLEHQTFLAFVTGGMVAGAAAALSSIKTAFLAYGLPALIPIIVRFGLLGGEFHLAMGAMLLLFGVIIFFVAHQIHTVRTASVKLRFENSDLVSYLIAEKEKLDKLNEKLLLEIRERERIETELRKSESRLRYLSAELLNAHEKERKLVAQEIHDSIGSSLASAKFKLQDTISRTGQGHSEFTDRLESIISSIQTAIEEARRIQMSLRPSMLDDLGILSTINWLCRHFESTYSTICIQREIEIQEDEFPDPLKIVVFRILQEALNNIAKHSCASAVFLLLRKSGGSIELAIQDNGQGFDPAETHLDHGTGRGLGLDSMKERVELSGGTYSIESKKGAGTAIKAFWPVKDGSPQPLSD